MDDLELAQEVAMFARFNREINAWLSKHGEEVQHIEAQVGFSGRPFSVRVWFFIGGLFVPDVYEAVQSPYGGFTVYAQTVTDGFYLWDKGSPVTSAAKLTQALDAAFDKARIRRLYLGFPLGNAQRRPRRRRGSVAGAATQDDAPV